MRDQTGFTTNLFLRQQKGLTFFHFSLNTEVITMAIELSNIIFTDQDDIVPPSGVEEIVNTGIASGT